MSDAFGAKILKAPILAVLMALSWVVMAPAAQAEKYAAIVVDADTGEILHARNEDALRYPASLTKVMTLYLLFDALEAGELRLDDVMTVSRTAAAQPPSNIRLNAGDKIRVEDAIHALVTKSANDVAVVVAEHLAGSERKFALLMNERARQIGLENTTFRNASGLPNTGQVSTARDLAILADALLDNHARYYHYFSRQRFSWGSATYENHNELVGSVAGVDGIKTGYTRASGFNLMTSAEREGRRVIVVMLGGASAKSRNSHVTELVETAFTAIAQGPPILQAGSGREEFASLRLQQDPNAAAEPLLNGRPLRAGLPHPVSPMRFEETVIIEGDAGDTGGFTPASPGSPAFEEGLSVTDYEARQTARAVSRSPAQ